MGMKDYQEREHTVGEHWNRVYLREWGHLGVVITKLGMVEVTVYRDTDYPYTKMLFVHAGKIQSRMWMEIFSRRTLVTLAKRFAREVSDPLASDPLAELVQ